MIWGAPKVLTLWPLISPRLTGKLDTKVLHSTWEGRRQRGRLGIDRLGCDWVLIRSGRNLEEGTDRMGWVVGGNLSEPLYDMCPVTWQGRRL